MKWVKCQYNETDAGYANVTFGEIYPVITDEGPILRIINNIGEIRGVFTSDFEDVTAQVIANERDNKLNDLLKFKL